MIYHLNIKDTNFSDTNSQTSLHLLHWIIWLSQFLLFANNTKEFVILFLKKELPFPKCHPKWKREASLNELYVKNWSIDALPYAVKSCQKPPSVTKICHKLPWVVKSGQKLSKVGKSCCQKLVNVVKSWQKLSLFLGILYCGRIERFLWERINCGRIYRFLWEESNCGRI